MKIEIDLQGGIDDLIESFSDSPEKVAKAIDRSLRKLSRFAESRTLREVSRQMKVTTKLLKELGRVKANLYKPEAINGQNSPCNLLSAQWRIPKAGPLTS